MNKKIIVGVVCAVVLVVALWQGGQAAGIFGGNTEESVKTILSENIAGQYNTILSRIKPGSGPVSVEISDLRMVEESPRNFVGTAVSVVSGASLKPVCDMGIDTGRVCNKDGELKFDIQFRAVNDGKNVMVQISSQTPRT